MWIFNQDNGSVVNDNPKITSHFTGYAGHGEGKNNPEMQDVRDVGPIPCGMFSIMPPHDSTKTGSYSMVLVPDVDDHLFGRGDFRIHGDSLQHPGEASDGCLILRLHDRRLLWQAGDRRLKVISGLRNDEPVSNT